MTDNEIIELYWQRDERAISETDTKYGEFCRSLSYNILHVREDAEECVNDTYHKAWTNIPPQRPEHFRAWLGRIVRNISFNLWHKNSAQKRGGGMEVLLGELEDCVPSMFDVEREADDKEIGAVISGWLRTLPETDRHCFVLRYWNGEPLNSIANRFFMSEKKLAQRMFRLRGELRTRLENEGISLS